MASLISLASPILLVILFHLLLETDHTCFASNSTQKTQGHRFTLTRVGFGEKLPKNQHALNSFIDAKKGAKNRPFSSIASRVKAHKDEYVMELKIGNPPVKFFMVMDTGSDLIWTKCKHKTSSSLSPSEDIESCDTYPLPAVCTQEYADGTSIKVSTVTESLTIGDEMIPNVTFGCGTPNGKDNFKHDGIVGMGRGKMSLISQLNENVFSYCLASSSEKSFLLTGSQATTSMANTNFQTTPLLKQVGKSYYYISLEGISVGETKLPISTSDFAIKTDGTGGMVIDSGTTFTYLENSIINMIEHAFIIQTKLNMSTDDDPPYRGLNRYFNSTRDVKSIPKLVFHFSGANWDLPKENYIYEKKGKSYLAFIDNDNDQQKMSIFGNIQQQNMMVQYNLDKNSLSFMPAKCSQL